MRRFHGLSTQDEITLWAAGKTVGHQWPTRVADPDQLEDLLTGHWARQLRQSPAIRTAILALFTKEPPLVLLAVSAVKWVSPAQYRAMFLILVQQTEAFGFAPMLAYLWTHGSRTQRAALSVEDMTACTQAQAGDLRLFAITVLLPAIDAQRHGPRAMHRAGRDDGRDHTVAGTVTKWGAQMRARAHQLAEKLRRSNTRSP